MGSRGSSPPAVPGFALEDAGAGLEHLVEGNGLVIAASLSRRDRAPGAARLRAGARSGNGRCRSPGANAAQDERRDARRQVHARGQPAGGDGAAIAGLGEHIGERRRADAVDRRRPLLLAERLAGALSVARSITSSAPSVLRYGSSLARPVEAMTRQPLSAKSEIAIEPTPPAAPVTSAAPGKARGHGARSPSAPASR